MDSWSSVPVRTGTRGEPTALERISRGGSAKFGLGLISIICEDFGQPQCKGGPESKVVPV